MSAALTNNFVVLLDFSYWVILCVVWSIMVTVVWSIMVTVHVGKYIHFCIIPEFLVGPSLGLLNLTLVNIMAVASKGDGGSATPLLLPTIVMCMVHILP